MIKLLDNIEIQTALPLDNRSKVKTLSERDNIPQTVRYLGLEVYVSDKKKKYRLIEGITNSHWVELKNINKLSELETDDSHMTVTKTEKDSWNGKADSNHTHTASSIGSYTKEETNNLLDNKANVNHGEHVPLKQTLDNRIYLRCDNTWHTITPSDIGAQPAGSYAAASHTHTAGSVGAYTKSEVDSKLSGKANSSHGNHVPATQSANNKVYLRNDNTWHTITPADIGAQPAGSYAAASHTHSEYQSKGNYYSSNGGTVSGNMVVTGTFVCNNDVTAFSDKELKTCIKDLKYEDIIYNFMNINFKSFKYKNNLDKTSYGVIAQDIQKIYPDIVVETDKKINDRQALGVNYKELFVQACVIIQNLENRIKKIEEKIF